MAWAQELSVADAALSRVWGVGCCDHIAELESELSSCGRGRAVLGLVVCCRREVCLGWVVWLDMLPAVWSGLLGPVGERSASEVLAVPQ